MPRPKMLRKVVAPPGFKGFKPYGIQKQAINYIELFYEEYEAIKLADYNMMDHLKASKIMGISRPTFARIYESARQKIALAFVETKEIKTVFGNAWLDKNWYMCKGCNARFTLPNTIENNNCPMCKKTTIESIKNQE